MASCDRSFLDYDESAWLYDQPPSGDSFMETGRALVSSTPVGVGHWDVVHFAHIARYGYTHEHLHAFFPAIPLLWRLVETIVFGGRQRWAATAFIISMVNAAAFGIAALALRALTWRRFDSATLSSWWPDGSLRKFSTECDAEGAPPAMAPRSGWRGHSAEVSPLSQRNDGGPPSNGTEALVGLSVLLFIVNASAPFTAAAYTESLFACFSMVFIWGIGTTPPRRPSSLQEASRMLLWACTFGVLAGIVRSNGMMLAGFAVQRIIGHLIASVHRGKSSWKRLATSCLVLLLYALSAAVIVAPYVYLNYVGYATFCGEERRLSSQPPGSHERHPDGSGAAECPAHFLGFYGYLQKRYWGVYWFFYYTPNNIPNFILAAPLFLLTAISASQMWRGVPLATFLRVHVLEEPNFAYLLAMLLLTLTRMHVQVATRFVACCPALYWIFAVGCWRAVVRACPQRGKAAGGGESRGRESSVRPNSSLLLLRCLLTYPIVFTGIGTFLFSNFLPWT